MNVKLVQYPDAKWATSMSMEWMNFLSVQVPATNDAQRIGPRQHAGVSSSTFESCNFAAQQCCGQSLDMRMHSRCVALICAQLKGVLVRSNVVACACRGSSGTAKQNALGKHPELWRL